MKPGARLPISLFIAMTSFLHVACDRTAKPENVNRADVPLHVARTGFITKLIKKESEGAAPASPPAGVFDLVRYPSPVGDLAAYLSPDPSDGKKHPIVIWLTGGFSNSISDLVWQENIPRENDQSASAYRKAGIPMMYPSLRGGNDNPGFKEGLFGEVDDVLAAAEYAAWLPWVDPTRIYLGGHSTGGTLAIMACQASPRKELFRAVFAFGPVEDTALYGQESLPFDITDERECELRAPVRYLGSIRCPTFVIEGAKGNISSLEAMRMQSQNPLLSFLSIPDSDHFALLQPTNLLMASKIKKDTSSTCNLAISADEVREKSEEEPESAFYPPGDVRSGPSAFGVVFYYASEPPAPPADALLKALENTLAGVPVVSDFVNAPEPPFVVVMEEKAPLKSYPVPDAAYFESAGRGMNEEDIRAIKGTSRADIVVLVTSQDKVWGNTGAFNRFVERYSNETRAFIWDSATRECFHPLAWKKIRVDGWGSGPLPDLRSQITIHLYRREDGSGHLRAITLGMEKFGLPDVAIERLAPSDNKPAGNLMNLFCQTIAANPVVEDPANHALSIKAVEPAPLRDHFRSMIIGKGTGEAMISVMMGTPDEGDPENDQIALDFRHGVGNTNDERRASVLAGFWGSADSVVNVRHDEELERLSHEAKLELPSLRKRFQAGLPTGSHLMVKAPFGNDEDGREWMWIEVMRWTDDDALHGVLRSDPRNIRHLKAGAPVTVASKDLFDYLLYHKDGSEEGNRTGKLLEQRNQNGK